MATSQNGYAANDITRTQSYKIPGTDRAIRLRKGSPGQLLVLFAAWFDKNVEDIDAGQLDDWGYAERPIRGQNVEYDSNGNAINLSNHASGTAEDLNATRHPLGKVGTFTATQAAKIRAKLKEFDGCIRWGGDYSGRKDEMHFEIVRDVAACDATLRKLTTAPPDEGDDPFMSGITAADIGKAVGTELKPALDSLGAKIDATEQKYVVADNNYDSQRAAWEATGTAYASHLIAGGAPLPADKLDQVRDAVWAFYRPLWEQAK